jgi:hypothetical protein
LQEASVARLFNDATLFLDDPPLVPDGVDCLDPGLTLLNTIAGFDPLFPSYFPLAAGGRSQRQRGGTGQNQ